MSIAEEMTTSQRRTTVARSYKYKFRQTCEFGHANCANTEGDGCLVEIKKLMNAASLRLQQEQYA